MKAGLRRAEVLALSSAGSSGTASLARPGTLGGRELKQKEPIWVKDHVRTGVGAGPPSEQLSLVIPSSLFQAPFFRLQAPALAAFLQTGGTSEILPSI